MSESEDVTVADAPEQDRFVVRVGGQPAGFAAYELDGDRIVFTHTEIDDAYEGKGLGSRLASAALDDARARRLIVVANCPFIAGYIQRHPEYADLTA